MKVFSRVVAVGAALGSVAWFGGLAGAREFFLSPADSAAANLQRADDAFLRKDLLSMTDAVRQVLGDGAADDVEQHAALELLDKAYEANGGQVPAAWQLPHGMGRLVFNEFRREQPDEIVYNVQINADVPAADSIQQMQLIQYPAKVVLDLKAGLGGASGDSDKDGTYSFNFDADQTSAPLPDGLYLLNIEMKDGQRTNGWFIVHDLVASASPTVTSPTLGEAVATGTPTLRWSPFRTPEYKPWESRHLALHLGHIVPASKTWEGLWSLYEIDPTRTSATVEGGGDGRNHAPVPDGKYWGIVSYQEQRSFGPIKLRRCASTSQYFYVKAKP